MLFLLVNAICLIRVSLFSSANSKHCYAAFFACSSSKRLFLLVSCNCAAYRIINKTQISGFIHSLQKWVRVES